MMWIDSVALPLVRSQVKAELVKLLELQASSVMHAELVYLQDQLQAIADLEHGSPGAQQCPGWGVTACNQDPCQRVAASCGLGWV